MQLPGTIKFNKQPNKEGEVTSGTGTKVKVNGKEVCVIGSMVTTCNDMGAQNNSTVIAVGASIPMPAIINPVNTESFKAEKAKEQKKKPDFTTVKWGKTSAKEGDELELSAQVKDIDDGNAVTFQIWKDGQDPASGIAQKVLSSSVEGGVAKVTWQYRTFGTDVPPSSDPKFFFSAHSAWCPFKKSGSATVELLRPEIKKAEWKDEETGSSSKGLVGKPLKLTVSCNSDTEEGAGVVFRIYPDGANPDSDQPIAEIGAENKGGKAEGEWRYRYKHDPENPLTAKPKFFFTATTAKAKMAKSGSVEIGMNLEVHVLNHTGFYIPSTTATFASSNSPDSTETITSNKGIFELKDVIPCIYRMLFPLDDNRDTENDSPLDLPNITVEPDDMAIVNTPIERLYRDGVLLSNKPVCIVIVEDSSGVAP